MMESGEGDFRSASEERSPAAMATASLIANSTQISQGAEAVSNDHHLVEMDAHNSSIESLQILYSHVFRFGCESSDPAEAPIQETVPTPITRC